MAKQQEKRRFFSPEFKLEAVRRMQERRGTGVSPSQIGRELGVRPDLLRAWARQAEERAGSPARDVFPGKAGCPPSRRSCGDCTGRTPGSSRRWSF
jgi:transposase-like protein